MLQGNDLLSSANTLSGIIYQKRENVAYYFSLKRMNDSLMEENARLRLSLAGIKSLDTLKDKKVAHPFIENDTTHIVKYANYIYRSARVINNSVTSENNYITINRGTKDGIQKNMAVISGNGAVGRVVHVSDHFASILSILSTKQLVSARLKDGTIGSVMWQEGKPDEFILEDIPQQIKVNSGDSVFTTSYSFFPADVLIGTVFKRKLNKKNNIQLLYLHSATNFRNLQYVYVVGNTMNAEKKQLEDSTKNLK